MMKYLIVFILLLTGCGPILTDPNQLKFKAGDRVNINLQFYQNCSGIIESYVAYRDSNEPPSYKVAVYCAWPAHNDEIYVQETNLRSL